MSITLLHYVHCPFCIRVRMALGYLKISYTSKVLNYDDEQTPTALTGKKMLPILIDEKGIALNESLDIIKYLDKDNVLRAGEPTHLDTYLNQIGKNIHSLAMPHWIFTPEFSNSSRQYFQQKKEFTRGSFKELIRNRKQFETALMDDLNVLSTQLTPYYHSNQIRLHDLLIASHLWGLYIVPEFQFPPLIHKYLQQIKFDCSFDYHVDFWL